MRIMFVVLAGLAGWLWFVSREPSDATPAPAPRARRADLSALQAQVAATRARTGAIELDPEQREAGEAGTIEVDPELLEAGETRDADLSDLAAQLEAAQQRADDLAEAETFDEALLDETVGHEVITITSHAPIIDTSSATHCGAIVDDYTVDIPTGRTFEGVLLEDLAEDEYVNIPVPGRTFESVLGAAASSQGQDDGVSFSSNDTLENVYVVDGTADVIDAAGDEPDTLDGEGD